MSAAREGAKRRPAWRAQSGFTLLELTIALVLLALLSAVLFGSLKLAGRSTGTAARPRPMRCRRCGSPQDFLRTNLGQEHPLRMRKIVQFPLLFAGRRDELRYTAELPSASRTAASAAFASSSCRRPAKSPLVLERMIPDLSATSMPDFSATPTIRCSPTASRSSRSAITVAIRRHDRRGADLARSLGRHATPAAPHPHRREAEARQALADAHRRAARSVRRRDVAPGTTRAASARASEDGDGETRMGRTPRRSPASRWSRRCGSRCC